MIVLINIILAFALQQQPDHSEKRCIVTEAVTGGASADCGEWSVIKGERVIITPEISKRLKTGVVFYFVWKEDRWIAEVRNNTLCVNTGEDREGILLSCNDAQKVELRIPVAEWPKVWHGPELGFAYEIDSEGQAVPSKPNPAALNQVRENSLKEGRRWRRPAMQAPR